LLLRFNFNVNGKYLMSRLTDSVKREGVRFMFIINVQHYNLWLTFMFTISG